MDLSGRLRPARAPLGRIYEGRCCAQQEPFEPPAAVQLEWCNFGYGRSLCRNFPSEGLYDAVRFSSTAEGTLIILERDYSPALVTVQPPDDSLLARQLAVFKQEWRNQG